MSAPTIWILLPLISSVVVFFFRRWRVTVTIAAILLTLMLAFIAWFIPIGTALQAGSIALKISQTLRFFGRSFILNDVERPLIGAMYVLTACWLAGSLLARTNRLFAPLSLAIVALLIAALAVEPFLYAALLIEVAALISVPLVSPPGRKPGRGVYRFFIFQTFGMPFILFVGWMLAGVEASPSDLALVVRAAVLMALGFAFLLPVFPFHSWLPMLAVESNPYIAAFIFAVFPSFTILFGVGFLNRYAWLRDSPTVYELIRIIGLLMVLLGGIWSSYQKHLGRILGYATMIEIGFSLLALSLVNPQGLEIFFTLLMVRAIVYILWGLSLARMQHVSNNSLDFTGLHGLGLKYPFLAGTTLIAHFSLAGLPLLAAFPTRLAIWTSLAKVNPQYGWILLVGVSGFVLAGVRTLGVLFIGTDEQDSLTEHFQEDIVTLSSALRERNIPSADTFSTLIWDIFLGFTWLIILFLGTFPQLFAPLVADFPAIFERLIP
jgi:formate hydrogenlyase subunit 3/multisubunit Na+/H+ antiporter MnhD subunit